jgi:hypothetical protein
MDGLTLKRMMLDALDEPVASELQGSEERILYSYLDRAATEFIRKTQCLKSSTTITTVDGQQTYDLPPDCIALYMRDGRDRLVIKCYDTANYSFPVCVSYEEIFRANLTDERAVPLKFAVIDKATPATQISGTATAAGAKAAGQCTLTDATKLFTTTNLVYPRDTIHNTREGSDGLILSVTDATHLVTALFGAGANAWRNGDAYVIQRAPVKQVVLDAPSSTSGYTLTVPYLCMPSPVYSDYGTWQISPISYPAIASEAAFMYQNRNGDYAAADRHHALFSEEVLRIKIEKGKEILRQNRYRRNYHT